VELSKNGKKGTCIVVKNTDSSDDNDHRGSADSIVEEHQDKVQDANINKNKLICT